MIEEKTLEQLERETIISALKIHRRRGDAALALGISRATLYRKLKKHNIPRKHNELST